MWGKGESAWRPDPWSAGDSEDSSNLRWWDGDGAKWTDSIRTWDGTQWKDGVQAPSNDPLEGPPAPASEDQNPGPVPPDPHGFSGLGRCPSCARPVTDDTWRVCPHCGETLAAASSKPGDVVNGHILGTDSQWHALQEGNEAPTTGSPHAPADLSHVAAGNGSPIPSRASPRSSSAPASNSNALLIVSGVALAGLLLVAIGLAVAGSSAPSSEGSSVTSSEADQPELSVSQVSPPTTNSGRQSQVKYTNNSDGPLTAQIQYSAIDPSTNTVYSTAMDYVVSLAPGTSLVQDVVWFDPVPPNTRVDYKIIGTKVG